MQTICRSFFESDCVPFA